MSSPQDDHDGRTDPNKTMKPLRKIDYAAVRNRGDGRTGLIYHNDMAIPECLWDENYEENPKRFILTLERIKELGLHDRCRQLEPRIASEEELLLVHDKDYIDTIRSTSGVTDEEWLEEISSKFDAVHFHAKTWDASLLAAGSAIELVDNVVSGRIRNGFGLIRPPGHHAMKSEACGFCFFNSVALAAKHAVDRLGVNRVLIVDWDVHHGQATQYTFDSDPRVLYLSIHRYEHGAFWPELIESNYNWVGAEEGKGFNCNVPLNETGMNDRDYLAIFHNLILPLAYRFNPELVLVSAGYDAAIGCPEGEMLVSPASYAHFTHSLMALAEGRVCVFLEGGYCLQSLTEGAALTLRALLGDPAPDIVALDKCHLHKSLIESVLDAIWSLNPYWSSLFPLHGQFDRHQDEDEQEYFRPRHFPIVQYKGRLALIEKPTRYETRNFYPVQTKEVQMKFAEEIQRLQDETKLVDSFIGRKRTALSYHEFMTKHKHTVAHPERPSRFTDILKVLHQQNLSDQCIVLNEYRLATDEEILRIHTREHLSLVKKSKTLSKDGLKQLEESFDSVYWCKDTEECARLSVGSLLNVVDAVMTDKCLNGFAVIRPPGHHARRETTAGFCIFNNIAIAAEYAIAKYSVKRILIFDPDVHHGDGTQSIVEGREDILVISLHRYDYAEYWPSSIAGGIRSDHKNIINIPWSGGNMTDSEYMAALFAVVLPVAYEFHPDLVLVSGGFDATTNDPLGEYDLSPELFGHLIHHLMPVAGGKVIVALEGGYNLQSTSLAVANCVSALMGLPLPSLQTSDVQEPAQETLREVVDFQRSRWPFLAFGVDLPENNTV